MGISYVIGSRLFALGCKAFFRDIEIRGLDNLPSSGGAVLVANHLNGLVDPLLFLRLPRPVTIVAKAALKKNLLLSLVIKAMGAETVHRQSDDGSTSARSQNQQALERLAERACDGKLIVIFPEGKSHSQPQLMPFKSGAARIVSEAWQRDPSVVLLPCAIFYSQKDSFRSSVLISILPPIRKTDLDSAEPSARKLTKKIEGIIGAEVPQFDTVAERDLANWLARLFVRLEAARMPLGVPTDETAAQLRLQQRISRALAMWGEDGATKRAGVLSRTAEVKVALENSKLNPDELFLSLSKGRAFVFMLRELEILILGAVFCTPGALASIIPYRLLRLIVSKSAKDEDHVATHAVFIGLPLFALWYGAIALVLALSLQIHIAAAIGVFLIYSTLTALQARDRVLRSFTRARAFLSMSLNPEIVAEMRAQVEALGSYLSEVESEVCARKP